MAVEWHPGEGWIPPLERESGNDPTHGFGWADALLVAIIGAALALGALAYWLAGGW